MRNGIAIVVLFFGTAVHAQPPSFVPADYPRFFAPTSSDKTLLHDVDVVTQLSNPPLMQLAETLKRHLEMEFEEIIAVCAPNKGQLAGLKTASDSAVEAYLDSWVEGSLARDRKRLPDSNGAKITASGETRWPDF